MVAPGHRLRGLKVGKARHHPVCPRLCLCQQGTDQCQKATFRCIKLIADPEFEICRHLVIARPAGVQAARRFTDDLFQAGLDVHVNVFEGCRKFESPALDL